MCLAELAIPYLGHHVELIETGSYEPLSRRFPAVSPAALDGHQHPLVRAGTARIVAEKARRGGLLELYDGLAS